jgi:hypothetical protein
MAGTWLLVVLGMATLLRVADALPGVALGLPRGVRRVDAVAELERITGRRMPVPAYYPDTIEWPPIERRYDAAGSAAIWCRYRSSGVTGLVIATAPPGMDRIAAGVMPGSADLQREESTMLGRPATLARVRGIDGAVWQQVQWRGLHQIITVRYRGTLDELMKVAGSIHE